MPPEWMVAPSTRKTCRATKTERKKLENDILLESRGDSIARLTLNRPESRNSLSTAMLRHLIEAISRLGDSRDVRVIVLAANGPGFCSGHDLRELTRARQNPDRGASFFEETMNLCSRLMIAITRTPKPVIAEVHGIATAAGCQLVATCDLAVASDDARFATPGVNIGLFCSTPMVALSRNVGRKASMNMLLTGDMIDADEARVIGLVNKVVPKQTLRQSVDGLAEKIASKAPAILRIGKEAFYQQIDLTLPEAYRFASEVMVMNMLEKDAEEGIGAFLEKRIPKWNTDQESCGNT